MLSEEDRLQREAAALKLQVCAFILLLIGYSAKLLLSNFRCVVWASGLRVQVCGLGFRVEGSGLRVQGLEVRLQRERSGVWPYLEKIKITKNVYTESFPP